MATEMQLPEDVNRGPLLLGVSLTLCIVSTIFASVRFYVRAMIVRNLGWDDYAMMIAVVLSIIGSALNIPMALNGVGRHVEHLSLEQVSLALKFGFWPQPMNILAFYFVKLSITLFLLRLKPGKHYQRILYVLLALLTVVVTFNMVVFFAQCRPLKLLWDPKAMDRCWSRDILLASAYTAATTSILTDWVYVIMPIVFLWNVKINPRTKRAIWALMALGSISAICSIVKFPYLKNLENSEDFTWAEIDPACWNIAELNVGIITACIPPMKPLFNTWFEQGLTLPWSRITNNKNNAGNAGNKDRQESCLSDKRRYPMHAISGPIVVDTSFGSSNGRIKPTAATDRQSFERRAAGVRKQNGTEDASSEDGILHAVDPMTFGSYTTVKGGAGSTKESQWQGTEIMQQVAVEDRV